MNSIIIALAALLISLGIGIAAPGPNTTVPGFTGAGAVGMSVLPDATPPPPTGNDVILSGGPS